MATYKDKTDGYVFDSQQNYGFGLTLKASGKAPLIAKRIWDSYEHMIAFVNDTKDSAIEGLILTVTSDTDISKRGAYLIKSVGNGTVNGTVEKLTETTSSSDDKKEIQTELNQTQVGAGLNEDGTYSSNTSTNYLKNATSLKDATEKLDSQIKSNVDNFTKKIESLDYTDTNKTNEFVTSVNETDGIISVERTRPTTSNISRDAVNGVSGTTAEAAIVELQKKIDDSNAAQRQFRIRKLSANEIDETVKEAYKIQVKTNSETDFTDVENSETIKIYKDSSVSQIYLGTSTDTVDVSTGVVTKGTESDGQSLNYVYLKANGKYDIARVDLKKFLTQSEFKDGLEVSETGTVSIKIDKTSGVDSYLTVSNKGIKLSGVTSAIAAATTVVSGQTNTGHVRVNVSKQSDGHNVYTVSESDIASAKSLSDLSGATLNSISTGKTNQYVTVTVGEKDTKHNQTVDVALQMGTIDTATEGLATTMDVYSYSVNAFDLSGDTAGKDFPEWNGIIHS